MARDWTKIYKKYKGQWVALAADQMTVLGAGVTLQEAYAKAKKKSSETPFMTRMSESLDASVSVV